MASGLPLKQVLALSVGHSNSSCPVLAVEGGIDMSPFDIPRKSSGTGGRQSQTYCSVMMSDIDSLVVVKPARIVDL